MRPFVLSLIAISCMVTAQGAATEDFTSLKSLLASTTLPPGVTSDILINTELYYGGCPTSVQEIVTAICFHTDDNMRSHLMSNIQSAGFWNPAIPTRYKATATDIASQWIYQRAVVAAVSPLAGATTGPIATTGPTVKTGPVATTGPIATTGQIATSTSKSEKSQFQRWTTVAQIFTILGPIIATTTAILICIFGPRWHRVRKEKKMKGDKHSSTEESDTELRERYGTATAANNSGSGIAVVAGKNNKTGNRYHVGDRNRTYYYGPDLPMRANAPGSTAPPRTHHSRASNSTTDDTWTPTTVSPVSSPPPVVYRTYRDV